MPPYYNKYKQFLRWLSNNDNTITIPLQRGRGFSMTVVRHENQIIGVNVTNLRQQGFLPIEIFRMIIEFLSTNPNQSAPKGNARNARIGSAGNETHTIEGLIAHYFYDKPIGRAALSRITPIANILINANDENNSPIIIEENGLLTLSNFH